MGGLSFRFRASLAGALVFLLLLGGCASTGNPRDPLESINRGIYQFNDGVDTVLLRPAAEVYRAVLPQFVRTGVHNVFSNINDVVVALNNLLQGKFLNATSDVGRIIVNTTVGVLGVLDVATEIGLQKNHEDFGQTLGFWGIGDGPYLVLPILGPSNLRDTIGLIVDFKTDPLTYVDPTRDRNAIWGLRMVNRRTELLETTTILEAAALDPYEFVRDAYLQRRRNLVHDGSPPPEKYDDFEIPMKPRSEPRDNGPSPASAQPGFGSLLVSGDAASTPARLEALESAARTTTPPLAAPTPSGAEKRVTPGAPPRLVRFWAPVSSR